jgi:hypothetical protein
VKLSGINGINEALHEIEASFTRIND